MHNLSLNQILSLWSDLEAAYWGKNGFGGDTAEIYSYRLMREDPRRSSPSASDSLKQQAEQESALEAASSLFSLLKLFCEMHECAAFIETGYDREKRKDIVRRVGPWMKKTVQTHRWHIKIVSKRSRE